MNSIAINSTGNIFIGTQHGLFRSTNNGVTWVALEDFLGGNSIHDIAINQNGVIFVSAQFGVFRSSDNGNSWVQLTASIIFYTIKSFYITSDGVIFVASTGGTYKSTNNGDSWQQLHMASTLKIVGNGLGLILAIVYNGQYSPYLIRSLNHGVSWDTLSQCTGITISRTNGNIYAYYTNPIYNNQSIVTRSIDNGNNWSQVFNQVYNATAISSNNDGSIYISALNYGVYRSTNNGNSWSQTSLTTSYVKSIAFNQSGHIFVGDEYHGITRSTNGGNSWQRLGLKKNSISCLNYSAGGSIYAGTSGVDGIFRTTNGGSDWVKISGAGFENKSISNIGYLANSNSIFVSTGWINGTGGTYRSTDDGISWELANNGLPINFTVTSLVGTASGNIFAAGSWDGRIFRSTNNGGNWLLASSPAGLVYSIAINNLNHLYITTNQGIYISTDNGNSWQQSTNGLPSNFYAQIIKIDAYNNVLLASGNGIYRSTNSGNSWHFWGLANQSITALVTNVIGQVFASTASGNVYMTANDGNNWIYISEGLPDDYINTMIYDPQVEKLFVGTSGYSVYSRSINEVYPSNVTLYSPGSSSQTGYSLSTISPIFLWSESPNSIAYGIKLFKKINNVFSEIYSNDNISGTSFYMPGGLLQVGNSYLWRIRANVNNNWTPYSEPFYFSIGTSATTPIIFLSSSQVQTGQVLAISGNNFTPGGQVQAVISSNLGYDSVVSFNANGSGSILRSFTFNTPGNYTVYCRDVNTNKYSSQKSFEVRGTAASVITWLTPQDGYLTTANTQFTVNWRDKLSPGAQYPTINNQRGYKYVIQISSNAGSAWSTLSMVEGYDDINKLRNFSPTVQIASPGNYLLRILDFFNTNRFSQSSSIQIQEAVVSNIKVEYVWDFTYQGTPGSPLGVVTDGTSRFYIKVTDLQNTISQVTLTLSNQEGHSEPRLLGKLMGANHINAFSDEANYATQTSANALLHGTNSFWCWYVAPDDFLGPNVQITKKQREVKVRVSVLYTGGGTASREEIITITRPPLFLVHGLNSSPDMWSVYYNSPAIELFKVYGFVIGPRESYEKNARSLLSSQEPGYSLKASIKDFREKNKLACNQAYYVGHSMGGIVLRYAQTKFHSLFVNNENYGKGYVNKFLTLATPHRGSPFANYLINKLPFAIAGGLFSVGPFINNFYKLNALNYVIDVQPAIRDLRMNAHPISATSFKSHVIVTDMVEGQEDFNSIPVNILDNLNISLDLRLALNVMTLTTSQRGMLAKLDPIYSSYVGSNSIVNSDMIVPLNSQSSNLSILNEPRVTYSTGFHSASTGGPSIEKWTPGLVSHLLDKSYFSEEWGTLGALNAENNLMTSPGLLTTVRRDSAGLAILKPSSLQTLFVDSTFEVAFTLQDTLNLNRIDVAYQDQIFTDTIAQQNYNFTLRVSSNYIDTQKVYISAYYQTPDSLIIVNNYVSVLVKSSETPIEIRSKQKFVYMLASSEFYPEIDIYYQNNISKIGTNGTKLNIMVVDPAILQYSPIDKKLTAIDDGDTYAVIEYNGLLDTIYFKVRGKSIIPVELLSFSASADDKLVLLRWSTKTESNNRGFEIERKSEFDNEYIKIGFVEGNGTSPIPFEYSYNDAPEFGKKYFYRLKQIDFDGTSTYSQVVEVNFEQAPEEFILAQNYPNPFNPVTTIRYSIPVTSRVTITIYNVLGQSVKHVVNTINEKGNYQKEFNATGLASGLYFYTIDAVPVNGAPAFRDTKKLILLK